VNTDYTVTITAREQAELLPAERDARPLGPQEVAGRTLVTLISAGTELASAYQGQSFPARPGYAAVFEVEEVGAEVRGLGPGDHAFCMGSHRSWQRMGQAEALKLPAGLPPPEAVFARLMGVSLSTLTTTTARPPQTVLVTGLGLVGHLAAQMFQSCGYDVLACDPDERRRALAHEKGIASVYPSVRAPDFPAAGRVALVLECSGHEQAALDGCRMVRKRGEVVLVGTPWRRKTELYAQELLHAVFHHYVVLRSGWEWELPLHPAEFRTGSIYDSLAAALRWLAEGRVLVAGLAQIVSPHDCQAAYQDLLHGRASRLAMVFDWRE